MSKIDKYGNVYLKVRVNGRVRYILEHRHIWEQAHGPIPKGFAVYHKNGDLSDNRLENLDMMDMRLLMSKLKTERMGKKWNGRLQTKKERQETRHKWYEKNKEWMIARAKKWNSEHKELCCEYVRKWKSKNPDAYREYRLKHKEKFAQYSREYRLRKKLEGGENANNR